MKAQISEALTRHRRLLILRMLQLTPGYLAPGDVLAEVLRGYGHQCAASVWQHDLEHLAALCLIELSSGWVAALTSAGSDVADGRMSAQGVSDPQAAPDTSAETNARERLKAHIEAALDREMQPGGLLRGCTAHR